jgi:hypothetical protein
MGDRTQSFVLRHPISLGDALAAIFRPRPKRAKNAGNPAAVRSADTQHNPQPTTPERDTASPTAIPGAVKIQ